ncbi:MAG: NAD(P)-dependent oxidoreductase [Actinomycetota bacterium]|nr:NAD(P)-dependent oxidoreductase [Actinomycetota bacterium]
MSTALVTGGAGFLGAALTRQLLDRGEKVTVLDAVPADRALRLTDVVDEIDYREVNLRDLDALRAVLTGSWDQIYHLAAVVGVDRYMTDPLALLDVNVLASREIIRAAAEQGSRLFFASTSEIYGRNPALPWREDDDRVLGPPSVSRWSYSSSKALVEHMLFAQRLSSGLPFVTGRFFNVYGPGQEPRFLISRTLHRALNGHPALRYDGGGQTRCFTYLGDAVAGVLAAVDSPAAEGRVFNIGSAFEHSAGEVVQTVVDHVPGTEIADVRTGDMYGSNYEDIERRVPDCRAALETFGWEATTTLAAGVEESVAWAQANPWWIALPLVTTGRA